jgi:hypothetical protein
MSERFESDGGRPIGRTALLHLAQSGRSDLGVH